MLIPVPLRCLLFSLLVCLYLPAAAADGATRPFLSPAFGSHMVLQRDQQNRFWGWTEPGTTVEVEIAGVRASAVAAPDGRWQVALQPPAAGGPYEVQVRGKETITLTNVLVGDVWLCSGQSNMEIGLARVHGGPEALKRATHPRLRLFSVENRPAYAPRNAVGGSWQECTPENLERMGGFSAVAYFFAERLQKDIDVPVGLVKAAVGGSPIESWMSARALEPFSEFAPALQQIAAHRAAGAPEYGNYLSHWFDTYEIGTRDGADWAAPGLDLSDWKPVSIPGGFADFGVAEHPSVVWFRREVTLPDPLPAGTARIQLGVVEKMDTTYINGRWVGASSWVENPRNYAIPADVLRPGRNEITVRVFKLKPEGGFQSPADALRLVLGDGTSVPLAGEWVGKLSVDARPPHPLPLAYENYAIMPTVLYNGMVAPFVPSALTGVLWYQGEANFTRAWQYRSLLPALVADWRQQFRNATMPVLVVSLPAFMKRKTEPATDGWAELRDAQALAARTVPGVETIVTIDVGDADDIHPLEKRVVGERLAFAALARHYGREVPYAGPRYERVESVGRSLRLHFSHVSGGLVTKGETLEGFAVAGEDRRWVWAKARIEGNTVVVSSPDVPKPVAARYAWEANPPATLFDGAGLPAMPFRTDAWPLSTQK